MKVKIAMVIGMCSLQVLDAISTVRAFAHGAVELNPIIGQDVARVLLFKAMACLVCCFLVMRTSAVRPETQMRRCTMLAVLFAVIVLSNWSIG